MEIVKKGIHYIANGTNGHSLEVVFCHKDETGKFVNGLTNEEMIDIMINRFVHLVEKASSEENIQCLLLTRQIKAGLQTRNKNKLKRKEDENTRSSLPVQVTSGTYGHEKVHELITR